VNGCRVYVDGKSVKDVGQSTYGELGLGLGLRLG